MGASREAVDDHLEGAARLLLRSARVGQRLAQTQEGEVGDAGEVLQLGLVAESAQPLGGGGPVFLDKVIESKAEAGTGIMRAADVLHHGFKEPGRPFSVAFGEKRVTQLDVEELGDVRIGRGLVNCLAQDGDGGGVIVALCVELREP